MMPQPEDLRPARQPARSPSGLLPRHAVRAVRIKDANNRRSVSRLRDRERLERSDKRGQLIATIARVKSLRPSDLARALNGIT
ncbi:ribosomal-protein-alanine acetyltransferase [Bradyrhizobium oligotrophicum S58]|uniref:Ribosomal-protein-alanine acetyltransferase n=1 Tax=Bradyrhizobium oligotrophicum S58 TaxID=1245469 RepID=M4Z7X5_9BRAD|nr:ribosomal-protein-alanine acetyltransferase [Bradyrhizobium oligotrophicum S58]